MNIDLTALSGAETYQWLTQTLLPRPIAWILSANTAPATGYNLAPFSYFGTIGHNPPTLMVSFALKPNGDPKDSAVNLEPGQHCVIHIASSRHAQAVNETARTLEHGDSELDRIDLSLTEFDGFDMPRLEDVSVAYGCVVVERKSFGNVPCTLVMLEIKQLYVSDEVLIRDHNDRLKVDPKKLDPLARLGGSDFGLLGEVVTIQRP